MITITFSNDSYGHCKRICSKGHANYDGYGKDIVCASVSILIINTFNSIEKFTNDSISVKEDDGYCELTFKNVPTNESELFIKSLILGLNGIKDSYGEKYIQIISKEV